ncbi:MAG: helix-turn-helix domain-containing protein [Alphaproteobacteria bacterium]|nr:helix-turn-helix domain-containing protein [Alphaproteobacteria bacterium]
MEIAGRGRILIWEGASLWLMEALPEPDGTIKSTAAHAHHAIQVTLSLGGRFELRTEDRTVPGDAVVAPDVDHVFEAVGRIAILFVEPESRAGRAIAKALLHERALTPLAPDMLGDLVARLDQAGRHAPVSEQALEEIGRQMVQRLAGRAAASLPDMRVRKMMDHVAARLDAGITLGVAAKAVGLSPGRARHLFVEQTGLPFRSYVLWLRMTRAVGIMSAGRSLTDAAHEAGFADSAHFSRTFRRMFGLPAAALQIS